MFDAFIKIEGIDGESRDAKHSGWVEFQNFSWGIANSMSNSLGGGGRSTGKAIAHSFMITKVVDKASGKLFSYCAEGRHIPTVTCVMRKATGGGTQEPYLTYKFSDVVVESVQWSGSPGGNERPMESVSLGYAKVEIEYKAQDNTGKLQAATQVGYDFAKNTKV